MMKKNILMLILFICVNKIYAQLDAAILQSYDSAFGFFVFKPNISIKVSDLVNQNSPTFRLQNNNTLRLYKVSNDEVGMKNYKYRQYYKNIKVEDSQFYIHTNQNDIPLSANGELLYNLNLDTSSIITPAQAVLNAINYANAEKYLWEDTVIENSLKETTGKADASFYPLAEKVIINLNADRNNLLPKSVLAYKVQIRSKIPYDTYNLFIDPNTGIVISQRQLSVSCNHINKSNPPMRETVYPLHMVLPPPSCAQPCNLGTANTLYYGTQNINTDKALKGLSCRYRLKNTCTSTFLYMHNGELINNQDNGNNEFHKNNNTWGDQDRAGTTALWCTERVHDFFRFTYGRNSVGGNSAQIDVWVGEIVGSSRYIHIGDQIVPGLVSTGSSIDLGRPDPVPGAQVNNYMTTLDIIGHEWTHGITISETGLSHTRESGALGESFSDIFGTMIDFYGKTNFNTGLQPNYIIGEECTSTGGLRNMANPNSFKDPDTYGGDNWVDPNCPTAHTGNNFCGIHTNSGVQNYWFYLLSEGGMGKNDLGNDYCVEKIGRDKAARIVYHSLTQYITANSKYFHAAFYSMKSAQDLYGANSNEYAQVVSAWYAVGIGPKFSGIIQYDNRAISNTQNISHNNEILFNNLQVTPTGNLIVKSNKRITIKPTSTASSGSFFHAYIAPGCIGGARFHNKEDNNLPNSELNPVMKNNSSITKNSPMAVIPNPSNGHLIVKTNNIQSDSENNKENQQEYFRTITVYNIMGEIILKNSFNEEIYYLNISNQPKGIYFVKVISAEPEGAGKVYTEKVILH